jgi:colicin import membrane protein
MKPLPMLHLLLGLPLAGLAWAMPQQPDADERRRLAVERKALEQRFSDAERACAKRFAVNACLERVQAERRAALAPFREAELRLDEAGRQSRADERRDAVARKQQALAQRPLAAGDSAVHAAPTLPAASRPGARTDKAPVPQPAPATRRDDAAEAARRAQNLHSAERRAEDAEARIGERRARQTEQLRRQGRSPDTLPRPAGAASQPLR